jgi:hypothetical protein
MVVFVKVEGNVELRKITSFGRRNVCFFPSSGGYTHTWQGSAVLRLKVIALYPRKGELETLPLAASYRDRRHEMNSHL